MRPCRARPDATRSETQKGAEPRGYWSREATRKKLCSVRVAWGPSTGLASETGRVVVLRRPDELSGVCCRSESAIVRGGVWTTDARGEPANTRIVPGAKGRRTAQPLVRVAALWKPCGYG